MSCSPTSPAWEAPLHQRIPRQRREAESTFIILLHIWHVGPRKAPIRESPPLLIAASAESSRKRRIRTGGGIETGQAMQLSSLRFSVSLGAILAVVIFGSVYAAFMPIGDEEPQI